MLTNFKIKNLIYLCYEGFEIDLHNFYNFSISNLEVHPDQIIIPFQRLNNNISAESPFSKITFTAYNYSYFQNSDPSIEHLSDDHTLSELTFYPSDDRQNNTFLIDQEDPKETDDLILNFCSDRIIRLKAEKIIVTHQTTPL